MARGAEAATGFLAGVLAKLSPEDRQKGDEVIRTLQGLGNGAVITAIGDGTLAQSEFSRLSDGLTEKQRELEEQRAALEAEQQRLDAVHEKQVEWYGANSAALAEYNRMRAATPTTTTTASAVASPTTTVGMTVEDYDQRIALERASFLGFQRDQNAVAGEHFRRFGEFLDLEPLLHHPQIREVGLKGAYQLVYKDRLEKHAADAAKAAEEKIRADERQKVLAQQATMPYPTPTGPGSGSPLDALQPTKSAALVDEAVAEYNRLQQARG